MSLSLEAPPVQGQLPGVCREPNHSPSPSYPNDAPTLCHPDPAPSHSCASSSALRTPTPPAQASKWPRDAPRWTRTAMSKWSRAASPVTSCGARAASCGAPSSRLSSSGPCPSSRAGSLPSSASQSCAAAGPSKAGSLYVAPQLTAPASFFLCLPSAPGCATRVRDAPLGRSGRSRRAMVRLRSPAYVTDAETIVSSPRLYTDTVSEQVDFYLWRQVC